MYLHQRKNWWDFQYDREAVMNRLGPVRAAQGLMLGRMASLGFDFQDEAMLATMSLELVRSCEIEGLFREGAVIHGRYSVCRFGQITVLGGA